MCSYSNAKYFLRSIYFWKQALFPSNRCLLSVTKLLNNKHREKFVRPLHAICRMRLLNETRGLILMTKPRLSVAYQLYSKSSELFGKNNTPAMFGNNDIAYGNKSSLELWRTLAVLFICKFTFITDNAVRVMTISYKVLGKRIADFLIRNTMYNQFVAGSTVQELKDVTRKLGQYGIGPILCTPLESDTGGSQSCHSFDANLDKILESLHLAVQLQNSYPMFQFRLSALMSADILKTVSQFCTMSSHTLDVINALIDAMKGSFLAFEKLPGWEKFPQDKSTEFSLALQRLGKIMKTIQQHQVFGLIDAEYTYINPAIRMIALALMKECNSTEAKILYTYQAYLQATPNALKNDLNFAEINGFFFGLKLVRGAYMVKEKSLAVMNKYKDPVHESFDQTTTCYNKCLNMLFEHCKKSSRIKLIIASHNEETICYALNSMTKFGLDRDSSTIFFAQLYGMADHVSYVLGDMGYRVYKSIPYGSLADTLPYLARRAQENKSILLNARRERELVMTTLKSRFLK